MLVAFPLSDLSLDGFGDIGAQQPPDVFGDGADQLGARALDDRLQMPRKLLLEARVGEQIQPLQDLHGNLLGQRAPKLLVGRRRALSTGACVIAAGTLVGDCSVGANGCSRACEPEGGGVAAEPAALSVIGGTTASVSGPRPVMLCVSGSMVSITSQSDGSPSIIAPRRTGRSGKGSNSITTSSTASVSSGTSSGASFAGGATARAQPPPMPARR